MNARDRFLAAMAALIGRPVVWGAKGPDAFDCSGSVTFALEQIGGPDLTHADNAQRLHDLTRLLGSNGANEDPLPGDLCFYGRSPTTIEHVAVCDEYGGVISADGATPSKPTLAMALADSHCRVRRHNTRRYRSDTPYIAVHRNTLVDQIDGITR